MQSSRDRERPTARSAISCVSRAGLNPYLDLLYGSLAEAGIPTGPPGVLDVGWLLRNRREVRYLHVHWPEGLYRVRGGPAGLRPYVSWLKVGLLAARLRIAHALGYQLIWTIHQVLPHESWGRIDRTSAQMLARSADLLLAHDPETATRARDELGGAVGRVHVVQHGSYIGVYPAGKPRDEVRRALAIPEDAVVFLCFGELRSNSGIELLLDAFQRAGVGSSWLIVAGNTKDRATGRIVASASERMESRVVRLDGFVAFEGVRELYGASDVAVVPRGDGGTSGSLILALSLGAPVIAADMPTNRRLLRDGSAGWLFRPGDIEDLRGALVRAAGDARARTERGLVAQDVAARLDWREAATSFALLLENHTTM